MFLLLNIHGSYSGVIWTLTLIHIYLLVWWLFLDWTMADFQKEMVSMGGKLKLKKGSGVTKSKKKTTDKSVSASMIGSSNLQPAALEGKRKSATNAPDNDESSSSVHDQVIVVQEVEWKPPTKTKAELAFIRRQKELQVWLLAVTVFIWKFRRIAYIAKHKWVIAKK